MAYQIFLGGLLKKYFMEAHQILWSTHSALDITQKSTSSPVNWLEQAELAELMV